MNNKITPEIDVQLAKVAEQNGMSLDTLKWNIFRQVEREDWREDIIYYAKEKFELENISDEFIEAVLTRLDYKYDAGYGHWENIEGAIEWTIEYMEENLYDIKRRNKNHY